MPASAGKMGTFLLKTAFLLAMAANLLPCHAVEEILTNGCMALNRDINFEDSYALPYNLLLLEPLSHETSLASHPFQCVCIIVLL